MINSETGKGKLANSCSSQKVWNRKENGCAVHHEVFKRNVAGDGSLDRYEYFLGEKIHMRKSSNLAKTKDAEFLGSKCIHNVKNYPLTIRLEEEGFL